MNDEIPIAEIIRRAGGPTAVAKLCDVDRTTPHSWDRVPPLHAVKLAVAIGEPLARIRADMLPRNGVRSEGG